MYIVVNSASLWGKDVTSYITILLMYSPTVLSSLWPNISLYGDIRFYSFIHQLTDIGLFLLSIMNNAVIPACEQNFFVDMFSVLLDINLGVRLLSYLILVYLTFYGSCQPTSQSSHTILHIETCDV